MGLRSGLRSVKKSANGITLREAIKGWERDDRLRVETLKKRETTFAVDRYRLRSIEAYFKDRALYTISEKCLTEYQAHRLELGRKAVTINSEIVTLGLGQRGQRRQDHPPRAVGSPADQKPAQGACNLAGGTWHQRECAAGPARPRERLTGHQAVLYSRDRGCQEGGRHGLALRGTDRERTGLELGNIWQYLATGPLRRMAPRPGQACKILEYMRNLVEPDGIEPTTSTMPSDENGRKSRRLRGQKQAKARTKDQ